MFDYNATLWVIPPLITLPDLVHDADTVKLIWDQGTRDYTEQAVRLNGVRAPETTQQGFTQTRRFVMDWLAHRIGYPPYGPPTRKWPLRLLTQPNTALEPKERESFTRWIGTVYDLVTGECLNEDVNRYLAAHPEWPPGRSLGLVDDGPH